MGTVSLTVSGKASVTGKEQGAGYLVPSAWYQVPGTSYLVPGTWYQVPGNWYLVPGTRYLVQGTRYQVPLQRAPVSGKVPVAGKVLRRPVTDRPGKR